MERWVIIISSVFAVTGVTRDKEYDITKGTEGSRILYFSANTNGEAETVKVILKPKPRQKLLVFEKDFSADCDQRTRFDGEYPDKGGCA